MKKKLLLDVCCGPCSTHVIKELMEKYDVSVFFTNSNVYPKEEYEKRMENARKVASLLSVKFIEDEYDHEKWLSFVKGLEDEKEGGKRCEKCFEYRLRRTFEFLVENGFDYLTTTLSVSPYKNFKKINEIGKKISDKFLSFDFKKKDGFKKSVDLSKEMSLYRQNYCGCEFSLNIMQESPKE